MKGLGRGPYARVLIFLIPSSSIAFLVNWDHPTSLCVEPSAVALRGEGGISYMWLGPEGRRGETRQGEARRGTAPANEDWRKDGCQWGERRERKGWHACSDDTQRD